MRGRLISVTPETVRIFKENGRYTTVERRRLSQQDVQYVDAQSAQLAGQY
ncbi:MAG: hypothetical protein K8T91_00920 [Planctomycetes bacterium]|nr:hypothetical protein [Planctomycetota bacterium]